MRNIYHPFYTESKTLTSIAQVIPTRIMPNFGPVEGVFITLTVAVTGATNSQTSNSILGVIQKFLTKDQGGKTAIEAEGTDLPTLLDMTSPAGQRVAATTITTNGSGAGSAVWNAFLPFSMSAANMPGTLEMTLAPSSVLQNGSFTSAGTVTVTIDIRLAYATDADRPTLRSKISTPPHQSGDNSFGPYLPMGLQLLFLAAVVAGGDSVLTNVTATHAGMLIENESPIAQYQEADTELMRSGHLSGELIFRWPVITVDTTTTVNIKLGSDSAVRLYSLSMELQKRSN